MAVKVEVRQATASDAADLAQRLRPEDRAELDAAVHDDPLSVIRDGVRESAEAWSVFFDGRLAFMWGVIEYTGPTFKDDPPGRLGIGWLLGTDLVEKHPRAFWKFCQPAVRALLGRWGEIANAIDTRHEKALRWAERLGFRLDPPQPLEPGGPPFRIFHVSQEDLACALRQ